MPTPRWQQMDVLPRRPMRELREADISIKAGVYALYRDAVRMYVGKAGCLQERIWKSHSSRGVSMANSAMRRNIAEYLGISSAADIKARRHQPSAEEVAAVRAWLEGCEIAWRECESESAAIALETAMKAEHMPPLTKR